MKHFYYDIYNVMTKINKEVNVNLRVREDVRDNFKIVAESRGASVSGLIHQFMVKLIKEERDLYPHLFEAKTSVQAFSEKPEKRQTIPISSEAAGTHDFKNKKK